MVSCIRLAGIAARARHFIIIIQKYTEYILMQNAWDTLSWGEIHDRSYHSYCGGYASVQSCQENGLCGP
jgi:hypothetical protein